MSEILYQRICKLIAINFAIAEEEVLDVFEKTRSVDKVLDMIRNGELK